MFKSRYCNYLKIFCNCFGFLFYRKKRSQNLRPPRWSCLWLLYLIILSLLNEQLKSVVSCELSFDFGSQMHLSVVINLTYMDPESGILIQDHILPEKFLVGAREQIAGIVIHVSSKNNSSHQACHQLNASTVPIEPFIVLIKYGDCKDQVKLEHVADAGAVAAVFYNDNRNIRFVKLVRKGNSISFAVVSQKTGEWLANLIENGTRVFMQMAISSSVELRSNQMNVLLVAISFILLLIFSFTWFLFCSVHRFRYIQAKEVLSKHLCSAAKKVLDKIPVKTVKMDDREFIDDYECCAVCFETFHLGELMRTLPCNHCFHKICIDPWLLEQRFCPVCKLDIFLHFGLVYTGSQESVLEIEDEEFRRHRTSIASMEHDVLVPNQRRHSGVRVSISEDSCSVISLDSDASIIDQSYVKSATVNAIDVIDSPSEAEYESGDERSIPKKREL